MLGTAGTWSLELFRPGNGVLGENSWNTKGVGEEGQTWKCTNKDPWTLCSLDHAACQGRAPNALSEERELPRYSGLRRSFVCSHTNKFTLEFPDREQGQASSLWHPKQSATPGAALLQVYSLCRAPSSMTDPCCTSSRERWEVLRHKHSYF